jgi:hypothetical protein
VSVFVLLAVTPVLARHAHHFQREQKKKKKERSEKKIDVTCAAHARVMCVFAVTEGTKRRGGTQRWCKVCCGEV